MVYRSTGRMACPSSSHPRTCDFANSSRRPHRYARIHGWWSARDCFSAVGDENSSLKLRAQSRTASDTMCTNGSAWKISTFFTPISSTKFKHCACFVSKPTSVNTIQRWYPRRTELAGRLQDSIPGLSTQKETCVEKCVERS